MTRPTRARAGGALAALAGAAALAGCATGGGPAAATTGPPPGAPGPLEVEAAVTDLDRALDALGPWPPHLPRSRDLPELPLVRVDPVEDLGRTGADLEILGARLERAVRERRRLRVVADENAVPEVLRAGGAPADPEDDPLSPRPDPRTPARAGLVLRAWTDRAGRVQLELRDLVLDERLARARTR